MSSLAPSANPRAPLSGPEHHHRRSKPRYRVSIRNDLLSLFPVHDYRARPVPVPPPFRGRAHHPLRSEYRPDRPPISKTRPSKVPKTFSSLPETGSASRLRNTRPRVRASSRLRRTVSSVATDHHIPDQIHAHCNQGQLVLMGPRCVQRPQLAAQDPHRRQVDPPRQRAQALVDPGLASPTVTIQRFSRHRHHLPPPPRQTSGKQGRPSPSPVIPSVTDHRTSARPALTDTTGKPGSSGALGPTSDRQT